jgi:ABC-type transport system involved in cytochrome bd biosynthesis fused ATPase/permease subunit
MLPSNLTQLEQNIAQARKESGQFFTITLVFASLGFAVVLTGVGLLLAGQVAAGIVSSISGIIPEVTAVLFFRKDKELRAAIERYHQYILDLQRILTMIDIAETVKSEEERDSLKKEIIYKALNIDGRGR